MERTYICIDLKSFYASVECILRGLDPLTTNLVVADPSRTEKTWLTRIALNVCRDMRRTAWFRHVDRRVMPEKLQGVTDPPDAHVELSIAVSRLPSKLQEAVLLYYYHGMTLDEMAEVLHTAKSTLSQRLRQAREKLHITLEGGDDHD